MSRETSIRVFRDLEMSGTLSRLRLLVAQDVAEHGPTTAGESCRRLQGERRPKYRDSFSQRFADLEATGVIAVVGERVCAVTGKTCLAWDLTGRMPQKLERKATRVELERERCRQLALQVASIAQTDQGRRAAQEIARKIQEAAR